MRQRTAVISAPGLVLTLGAVAFGVLLADRGARAGGPFRREGEELRLDIPGDGGARTVRFTLPPR